MVEWLARAMWDCASWSPNLKGDQQLTYTAMPSGPLHSLKRQLDPASDSFTSAGFYDHGNS